jgi:hypothetical protein
MVISVMGKNYSILRNTNWLVLGIIIIGGFYLQDAYAYIDPGSGSIVIQMIIGALVGVGITLKLYWYKFKEKVLRIHKKDDKP